MLPAGTSRLFRVLVLLTVASCLAGRASAEGGWTRQPGSFYAKVSLATIQSSEFFSPAGEEIQLAEYDARTWTLYAEYGVTKDLTVILDFPFSRRHALETTETFTGPGDATIELKYALSSGRFPVAAGVLFGIPTGNEEGAARLRDAAPDDALFRLPAGDGEFNTRVSLSASHSFSPVPAFVSAGGGYNFRTEGFTDEVSYFLQLGWRIWQPFSLSATFRGLRPASTPDKNRSVGFGLGEGVAYTTVGAEAAYEVARHYSVSAGYFTSQRGKNIYTGPTWVFGIAVEY